VRSTPSARGAVNHGEHGLGTNGGADGVNITLSELRECSELLSPRGRDRLDGDGLLRDSEGRADDDAGRDDADRLPTQGGDGGTGGVSCPAPERGER